MDSLGLRQDQSQAVPGSPCHTQPETSTPSVLSQGQVDKRPVCVFNCRKEVAGQPPTGEGEAPAPIPAASACCRGGAGHSAPAGCGRVVSGASSPAPPLDLLCLLGQTALTGTGTPPAAPQQEETPMLSESGRTERPSSREVTDRSALWVCAPRRGRRAVERVSDRYGREQSYGADTGGALSAQVRSWRGRGVAAAPR